MLPSSGLVPPRSKLRRATVKTIKGACFISRLPFHTCDEPLICRAPTSAILIHDSPLREAAVRAVAHAPAAADEEEEILIVDETKEDPMDGLELLPVAAAGDAAADDGIIALPVTEARLGPVVEVLHAIMACC